MTTDGSVFRWQKQGAVAGGAGGRPVRWQECANGKGHQHRSGCYLPPPNWRKLVRKLRKQSRCLCSAATTAGSRPSAFHCHYDPMSYAQNFDRGLSAAGSEDSDHFRAFSARFVMTPPPKTPPPQLAAAGAAIATATTTTTTPNSVETTTTATNYHHHH